MSEALPETENQAERRELHRRGFGKRLAVPRNRRLDQAACGGGG